jgi:hypothetical protein
MEGDFAVGNHFMLKPKGIRPVKITITEINDGCSFTDCTTFPGAKIMTHTPWKKRLIDGCFPTHLIVTGPLKWLWINLVAQNVADTVPGEVDALVNLARSMNE